ncbi:hypothetical protein PMAYCL1PPCAC_19995, partial [Pristionchus mayeri]
ETSRTMKACVDGFALQTPQIPIVTRLAIMTWSEENEICFQLGISKPMSGLFALGCKLRESDPIAVKLMRRKLSIIEHQVHADYVMSWILDDPYHDAALAYIKLRIGKCITRRISILSDSSKSRYVSEVIHGMRTTTLEITLRGTLTDEIAKHLVDGVLKFADITLTLRKVSLSDPARFLTNLSTRTRAIYISQSEVDGIPFGAIYFLGLINADWAPTIIEMFSNGIDKLNINNVTYPAYLSADCVRQIKERLPFIGRKVALDTLCSRYDDRRIEETVNDHAIHIAPVKGNGYLRIRHVSQRNS